MTCCCQQQLKTEGCCHTWARTSSTVTSSPLTSWASWPPSYQLGSCDYTASGPAPARAPQFLSLACIVSCC
ncbi:uncharacterized [Tachysurus ichikawai]